MAQVRVESSLLDQDLGPLLDDTESLNIAHHPADRAQSLAARGSEPLEAGVGPKKMQNAFPGGQ